MAQRRSALRRHARRVEGAGDVPERDWPSRFAWLTRAAVYRASGKSDEAVIGLRATLDHAYRHHVPGRVWSILWILAGWSEASDEPVINMRIRAAAESAFAVFGWPDDKAMFGIGPMPDVPQLDPIDLDESVTAAIRRPGVGSR